MTWVRLDDQFFRHRKARAAGRDGRALYLAALCFSAANLTDGRIRTIDLPLVAAEAEVKASTAQRLVAAGLWDVVDDGWQIHDWGDLNPTAEEVKERREKEKEKKRRHRRGTNGRYVSPGDTPGDGTPDRPGDTPGESRGLSDQPTPTPTKSVSKSSSTNGCKPAAATTIEHIADQRIAKLATPPANPNGYRQTVVADVAATHGQAIATLVAERPELDAAGIAAIIEPQAPPRPRNPADTTAEAQRRRDQRLAATARGEACPRCGGLGVIEAGDGTYDRCPECQP